MNFLQRNKPIFIVGVLLGVIFLILIVLSVSKGSGSKLLEAPTSIFNIIKKENSDFAKTGSPTTGEVELFVREEEEEKIPAVHREVGVINFTTEGFSPDSIQATQGQTIRWVNALDRDITIKELIQKHVEFEEGVVIEPGRYYELKLYGTKLWTYKEMESGEIGRMLIAPTN